MAALAPVAVAEFLVLSPVIFLPWGGPPCTQPGHEYLVPAGSTLVVVITKDHHVNF